MADVHATAVVSPDAVLAANVSVGPYCIIGPGAVLEEAVQLAAHVSVQGRTRIGARTSVAPFASLGGAPQSLGDAGEGTALEIGPDCQIREYVSLNRGTRQGGGVTRLGARCFVMAGAHVGHDCLLGDHVTLANNVMLAGHVTVGDFVWFGGASAIHQHGRVGRGAFVGGMAGLEGDLIPFGMATGNRGGLEGLNIVGMKRRGFSREAIHTVRRAVDALFYGEGQFEARLAEVEGAYAAAPEVMEITGFIRAGGKRPLLHPRGRG